jgi:ParB-like chromosome segregation protein Spo0J
MLKPRDIPIDEIYVPVRRRKTLDPAKADELAEDILENGQKVPIQVRQGKGRFVLVEGLHRLEACISLGEEKIPAYLVQARKF